jgi:hypothetical protein
MDWSDALDLYHNANLLSSNSILTPPPKSALGHIRITSAVSVEFGNGETFSQIQYETCSKSRP